MNFDFFQGKSNGNERCQRARKVPVRGIWNGLSPNKENLVLWPLHLGAQYADGRDQGLSVSARGQGHSGRRLPMGDGRGMSAFSTGTC